MVTESPSITTPRGGRESVYTYLLGSKHSEYDIFSGDESSVAGVVACPRRLDHEPRGKCGRFKPPQLPLYRCPLLTGQFWRCR